MTIVNKKIVMKIINKEPINALSNQLMLDKLAQCNCCQKHQINKPKTYIIPKMD